EGASAAAARPCFPCYLQSKYRASIIAGQVARGPARQAPPADCHNHTTRLWQNECRSPRPRPRLLSRIALIRLVAISGRRGALGLVQLLLVQLTGAGARRRAIAARRRVGRRRRAGRHALRVIGVVLLL